VYVGTRIGSRKDADHSLVAFRIAGGILERLPGTLQELPVLRINELRLAWRIAEQHRVKMIEIFDVITGADIIRVLQFRFADARFQQLRLAVERDRFDPRAQILPKLLGTHSTRETARHSDQGDVVRGASFSHLLATLGQLLDLRLRVRLLRLGRQIAHQGIDGRRLVQHHLRELDVQLLPEIGYHLQTHQRVAAQIEEVVPGPDLLDAQRTLPDAGNPAFQFVVRRHEARGQRRPWITALAALTVLAHHRGYPGHAADIAAGNHRHCILRQHHDLRHLDRKDAADGLHAFLEGDAKLPAMLHQRFAHLRLEAFQTLAPSIPLPLAKVDRHRHPMLPAVTLRECIQKCIARAVVDLPRTTAGQRRYRRDQDHEVQRRLGECMPERKRALDLRRHDLRRSLRGLQLGQSLARQAGSVEDAVDDAEASHGLAHRSLHLLLIRDIRRDDQHLRSRLHQTVDLAHSLRDTVLLGLQAHLVPLFPRRQGRTPHQNQLGALGLIQVLGQCQPDTAHAAGNEVNPAFLQPRRGVQRRLHPHLLKRGQPTLPATEGYKLVLCTASQDFNGQLGCKLICGQ